MQISVPAAFPSRSEIDALPLFFILGRPRSGTTLLASLFDAHPSVILPFECPYIINIQRKYSTKVFWTETEIRELCYYLVRQRGFESWRVNPEQLINNLISIGPEIRFSTLIKAIHLHFRSFFPNKSVQLIGDKNPVYSIYPERLFGLFPDARFIYLTRDYRDTILSIKKVDFESPFTPLLAWRWRYVSQKINRLIKQHPSQFVKIRHEELVAQPQKSLEHICSFLGISFDPSVLHFHKIKDELLANFPSEHILKYHSSLLNPIDSTKVYGWKKEMSAVQVKMADAVAGRYAELDGYQRAGFGFPWLQLPWIAICVIYGWLQFQLRFFTDHFPFRLLQTIRTSGPLLAVIYSRLRKKMFFMIVGFCTQ